MELKYTGHACLYQEDINQVGADEYTCNCCARCEEQCQMAI